MAEAYYDFDAEARRKRSLAEESLEEQMLSLTRAVARSVSALYDATEALLAGDDKRLKDVHVKVKQTKELVESMKEDALSYLARLGDLLSTASLYRSTFLTLTRVAQMIEGVTYRAYLMTTNSSITSNTIRDLLLKLTNTIAKEHERLEHAIRFLTSNPKRSYEEAQVILSLEDEADDLYRQLSLAMYKELYNNMVGLMLLRDIVEMMEDVADLIRDASEDVKFLALHKAQRS